MTAYIRVSATVFSIVALLQALRVARGWPLDIAGTAIPLSASIIAAVVAGALAVWGWSAARGGRR